MLNTNTIYCKNHPNRKAYRFCDACKEFICNYCAFHAKHISHFDKIKSFKDLLKTYFPNFQQQNISNLSKYIELFHFILNYNSSFMPFDLNEIMDQINEKFDNYINKLVELKMKMKILISEKFGILQSTMSEQEKKVIETQNKLLILLNDEDVNYLEKMNTCLEQIRLNKSEKNMIGFIEEYNKLILTSFNDEDDFDYKYSLYAAQKLIDKSFMSENRDFLYKKKKSSKNNLFLSQGQNKDKIYTFNNNKNTKLRNIKTEKKQDRKKSDVSDSISINTSIYDIKNSPVLSAINKQIVNDINSNKNTPSKLTFIDTLLNNNKFIDTYESTTIANIDKHCDSLLSKINKKLKIKENYINKEEQNDKYHTINVILDDINLFDNDSNIKNIKICKKLISNASLCRKGLNRPEEDEKINQDTLFKVKFGDLNYSYYGVCDGHGPLGHLVSDYIKSNLTFIVYKHLKSLLLQKSNSKSSNNEMNFHSIDDSFINFPKLFKECFILMESKLVENKSIDIQLSGTTCISLLFCEDRIISANIGDSRAIKCFYDSNTNKWRYIPLSRDHKPSEQDEARRIKECKGIIHPYVDDDGKYVGPDRVWNEGEELPGLAMSRSFGDEIAKEVGVYSEPEVKIFPYNNNDKFIVIASDGLWEYVNNNEVADIVGKYHEMNDCDGAVSKLYEIAKERWVKYDDYIDDISIIVVFLDDVKL